MFLRYKRYKVGKHLPGAVRQGLFATVINMGSHFERASWVNLNCNWWKNINDNLNHKLFIIKITSQAMQEVIDWH